VPGGFVAELDPAAREALERLGRPCRYDAGTMLLLEGDLGSRVVVIRSGYVKVVATSDGGHTIMLAVRGPGDVLGDLSAIDGEPRSASAITLEPVEAQVMTADEFRGFLTDVPGAAFALLRVVVERVRDSDQRRVEYGALDTLGRVALRLVELADTVGEPVDGAIRIGMSLTQDDLAGWVAASREAVARALASLRRRNLIATGRREITILDLGGLRDASR
jgi:CRP-like cAMP-binding protein